VAVVRVSCYAQLMPNKIKSFTDLISWQQAHQLVLVIYEHTKFFPKRENYSLTDQIRRASLTEIQNQLLIAKDLTYLKKSDFESIANQSIKVHKLINGLIKSLRSKRT